MNTLIQKKFEEIYRKTYRYVLKYIVCKCQNLDDVNDLIQDVYVELYEVLEKKHFIKLNNETAYIIGIAKNILKKYYKNQYKDKENTLYLSNNVEELDIEIISNYNLEANVINKENISKIWDYLNKKNPLISKIFYLYYSYGLKISEISKELSINETNVKHYIYRTLKELEKNFGKEEEHEE